MTSDCFSTIFSPWLKVAVYTEVFYTICWIDNVKALAFEKIISECPLYLYIPFAKKSKAHKNAY